MTKSKMQKPRKRMGRPLKPETQKKSRLVQLRMSGAEYQKLAAKAKKAGKSVSEFLRQCGKDLST